MSVHVGITVQLTQQVLDMTPEKRDLLELLGELKHMWYPIGEMLNVGRADLEGLHCSNCPDNERLSATLQCWIDSNSSPVTWGIILKVLRTNYIDQPRVADKIQHYITTLATTSGDGASTTASQHSTIANQAVQQPTIDNQTTQYEGMHEYLDYSVCVTYSQ